MSGSNTTLPLALSSLHGFTTMDTGSRDHVGSRDMSASVTDTFQQGMSSAAREILRQRAPHVLRRSVFPSRGIALGSLKILENVESEMQNSLTIEHDSMSEIDQELIINTRVKDRVDQDFKVADQVLLALKSLQGIPDLGSYAEFDELYWRLIQCIWHVPIEVPNLELAKNFCDRLSENEFVPKRGMHYSGKVYNPRIRGFVYCFVDDGNNSGNLYESIEKLKLDAFTRKTMLGEDGEVILRLKTSRTLNKFRTFHGSYRGSSITFVHKDPQLAAKIYLFNDWLTLSNKFHKIKVTASEMLFEYLEKGWVNVEDVIHVLTVLSSSETQTVSEKDREFVESLINTIRIRFGEG